MCIVALAWQLFPACPLLLLSNRDEFYARPATALHQWQDSPIYAGKDLLQGGTWLGVTEAGRWAVVTNIREPSDGQPLLSRGQLVSDYLNSEKSPMQFAHDLVATQQQYSGFNLIVGNRRQAVSVSNRGQAPQPLAAGVYVVSNGLMEERWEKNERLRQRFTQELLPLLQTDNDIQPHVSLAWALLQDTRQLPTALLPDTGLSVDIERPLSAVFIHNQISEQQGYGTRCSNVLQMVNDKIQWWEKQQQGEQQGLITAIQILK